MRTVRIERVRTAPSRVWFTIEKPSSSFTLPELAGFLDGQIHRFREAIQNNIENGDSYCNVVHDKKRLASLIRDFKIIVKYLQ